MGGRIGAKRGKQVNVPILQRSQAIRGSPFLPRYPARPAMQGGCALPNVSSPGDTHGNNSGTDGNGTLPALPATHAESWCARSGVSWATLGARRSPRGATRPNAPRRTANGGVRAANSHHPDCCTSEATVLREPTAHAPPPIRNLQRNQTPPEQETAHDRGKRAKISQIGLNSRISVLGLQIHHVFRTFHGP